MLLHAYDYAKAAHANQKRASGEPYFIHPCAVAEILVDLGLDPATIAAALLHDVIEDTPVTEEDIRREFGEEVLSLVAGVTKLDKIVFKSQEEEEAENFRKLFIAMAKDIRVIIIKLADRLHNMRSLNFLSKERQQRMARETLDIYTPSRAGWVFRRSSASSKISASNISIPRRSNTSSRTSIRNSKSATALSITSSKRSRRSSSNATFTARCSAVPSTSTPSIRR